MASKACHSTSPGSRGRKPSHIPVAGDNAFSASGEGGYVRKLLNRTAWFLLCVPLLVNSGEVVRKKNPDTGLLSWKVKESGLSIEFIQVLPDYVAAVYGSRDIPPAVLESMAGYCVFGTILKNESAQELTYRMADWRYVTRDGSEHRIKTKTEWVAEWKGRGVSYRWSLLPDDQVFEPGDWSQGFITFRLPPDSVFDLKFSWRYQGEEHTGTIRDMRCAPARPPGE